MVSRKTAVAAAGVASAQAVGNRAAALAAAVQDVVAPFAPSPGHVGGLEIVGFRRAEVHRVRAHHEMARPAVEPPSLRVAADAVVA